MLLFDRSLLIESATDGIYSSVLLLSEYVAITSTVLELLIGYMYKGSIELSRENVEGVMEAADTLQMEELKKYCQDYKGKDLVRLKNAVSKCEKF